MTILSVYSCTDLTSEINTSIPTCVQIILINNNQIDPIRTIRVQENNNELHYWINTDVRIVDGVEAIFNSNCDTVCTLGGFIPPDCSYDYDEEWILIWSK